MRPINIYRSILILCAAMVIGAGGNICPVHNKEMTKKKVAVILLVDRRNPDYWQHWQEYTNARARLFPNSCDELNVDANEVLTMTSKQLQKKFGWKRVPSHISIDVCPVCDERKGLWLTEHPYKTYKKDEIPPP